MSVWERKKNRSSDTILQRRFFIKTSASVGLRTSVELVEANL